MFRVKHEDYSNLVKNDAVYKSLVDLCQAVNLDCDLVFVMKKIVNLRIAFRKEHAEVNNSMKSGARAYEIYEPKLWYYHISAFTGDDEWQI